MNALEPNPAQFLLPPGARRVTHGGPAVGQGEFVPLPSIVLPSGAIVTQWEPTADELDAILRGQAITLILHTPLQPPMQLFVGGADLRNE
jgi:hypothetical protein